MLGQDPIAAMTENTTSATLCANLYPLARLDTMRVHPWNCLIKRVVLAPLSDAPAFDWSYAFQLPGDWLRTLQVGQDGDPTEYEPEGRTLLANTNVLYLRYVADVSESQWDSLLVQVMTKRMEMDLAYPVTKSASHRDSLKEEFYARGTGVLARAKAVDGQEAPPQSWDDSSLINVRMQG